MACHPVDDVLVTGKRLCQMWLTHDMSDKGPWQMWLDMSEEQRICQEKLKIWPEHVRLCQDVAD